MTYINHFNTQFAGEVGLVSVGLGKHFTRYSIGGMYGVVPAEISGGPFIETITLRQTYDYYFWKRVTFHVGMNIFHVLGVKYQTENYGSVPENYYPVGAIRVLFNPIGVSATINRKQSSMVYFESGWNDISLLNYFNNNEVINPLDDLSLALGFRQKF